MLKKKLRILGGKVTNLPKDIKTNHKQLNGNRLGLRYHNKTKTNHANLSQRVEQIIFSFFGNKKGEQGGMVSVDGLTTKYYQDSVKNSYRKQRPYKHELSLY